MSANADDEPGLDLHDLLHPDEQRRFRRLCLATSSEELAQLTGVVQLHVDHIRHNASQATDVETAQRIGEALIGLVSSGIRFDAEERALIRGAVEYFLLSDDAAGDLDDAVGFDDDARVVNSVLQRIGQPRFRVELPS